MAVRARCLSSWRVLTGYFKIQWKASSFFATVHVTSHCFVFSQQTHHQPGSSSRKQGESWAAASARGHPGHLWSLFQRIPGGRQAHSSLLLFMLNGLTQFVERLHISSCSFFPVDGDFGQDVGPMSTLPKSVSSVTPAFVGDAKRATLDLCISGVCLQLLYWPNVPAEEEPAVLPALHCPRSLHCRTYGECV